MVQDQRRAGPDVGGDGAQRRLHPVPGEATDGRLADPGAGGEVLGRRKAR